MLLEAQNYIIFAITVTIFGLVAQRSAATPSEEQRRAFLPTLTWLQVLVLLQEIYLVAGTTVLVFAALPTIHWTGVVHAVFVLAILLLTPRWSRDIVAMLSRSAAPPDPTAAGTSTPTPSR